jgi:hypothetical protein
VLIDGKKGLRTLLYRTLRGKDHLRDIVIDGRILLKLILDKDMRVWTGFV